MKLTALDYLSSLSVQLLKAHSLVKRESGQIPTEARVSFEDFAKIETAANAEIRSIANLIIIPDIQLQSGECILRANTTDYQVFGVF